MAIRSTFAMAITYDDFDTEKYESFDAQMQIIEGGANIVSEYAGSTAPGDGISLTNKQTMSDIVYKLKRKMYTGWGCHHHEM